MCKRWHFKGALGSLGDGREQCISSRKLTFGSGVELYTGHWTLLVIVKDQSSHLVYHGVSQHMHKITNLWNLSSIDHRSCEITIKTPLSHEAVCFQIIDFETSSCKSEVSQSNSWKITSFSKATSEGAVSHNVLYHQQLLPITRNQVRFYDNNFFLVVY